MPKDRLADLHRRAARRGAALEAAAEAPAPDPGLDAMLLEVERMRDLTVELRRCTAALRRLHADPTFHTSAQLQAEEEAAALGAQAAARKLCAILRQFEAEAVTLHALHSVRGRIARLQSAAARAALADALADHHAALGALRDDRRLLLARQIHLTNLTISDEECESLLDSNNISIFVDNVQSSTAAARLALRDAEARLAALRLLEGHLADVRDLFLQLALLVAHQQEQIDSVEYYALQASEYVETGGRQLLHGTVSKARAQKKKLGLVICLVSGAAVVLLVLLLT